MKVKSILAAVAVAALAVFFATPVLAAIGNQGRILYTKDVVRDADGNIQSTGNLFVKDLVTGTEQQITNYTGTYSILNPMFSADGSQIIYTSNVPGGAATYKVYIVSADASVSAGVGIELQSGPTNENYTYAALSPDGKTIAFVRSYGTTDSLWTYDRTTGLYQQVYEDPVNGIMIKNVVFVNDTTLAFIGTSNGIQNIYVTDLTGPNTVNLTNNTTANTKYLGLKSAYRSTLAGDLLIYGKRVKVGTTWQPWDVYVATTGPVFLEFNVTNTNFAGQDEYEPCFYGDDAATRDVQLTATNGNMFYVATVIGSSKKVWQANFDTAGGPTNTGKTQRTEDPDIAGQPDWAPPVTEQAPVLGVDATEIAFTVLDGTSDRQIRVGDFTDATTMDPIVSVTNPESGVNQNPSLGAARIVYDVNSTQIMRMNSDGTNNVEFVTPVTPGIPTGTTQIKMPSISPDGKWVFFVAGPQPGNKNICAKLIDKAVDDTAIALTISGSTNPEDPVVSPDMSSLVWVENSGGVRTIYKVNIECNAVAGTVSVIGTPQILGGNQSALWNDKDPSFSPDGTRIIFVSDRDGTNKIYTMDAGTGLGVVNQYPLPAGVTDPAYPQFSPIGDGSIVYVATVGGQRVLYSSAGQILDATGNPIVVTGDKFSWKIERKPGQIVAERTLQPRAAAGVPLTYSIKIDVDEGKTPVSYTLEEVIPSWTVVSVKRDGTTLDTGIHYYELNNTPTTGLKTLKFVFAGTGGSAGTVADHILTIDVTAADTGTKVFSGTIAYFLDGQPQSSMVTGNGILSINNPFCPIDKYNARKESNKPDGIIQDLDLLFGIEAWSSSEQLPGYGTGWPADPDNNWDGIILAAINIWASPAGTRGWYTGDNQVTETEASEFAGQYRYVGPNEYQSGSGQPPVAEMYWTQGKWQN